MSSPLMSRTAIERLARVDAEWCVTVTSPLFNETFDRRRAELTLRALSNRALDALEARGVSPQERDWVRSIFREWLEDLPRSGAGVALFVSPDLCERYVVPSVPPRVLVGETFALSELAAQVYAHDDFYALALGDEGARLVLGSPSGAARVDLPLERVDRADANLERVSPTVGGNRHAARHAAGKGRPGTSGQQGFGHEDRDRSERTTWYGFVIEGLAQVVGTTPVVLVADVAHHALFRERARRRIPLVSEGVKRNPRDLSDTELAELARPLAPQPPLVEGLEGELSAAAREGRVAADLEVALAAAQQGQVARLIWIPASGADSTPRTAEPTLEALAAQTLRGGGELVPVASDSRVLDGIEPGTRFAAVLRWS